MATLPRVPEESGALGRPAHRLAGGPPDRQRLRQCRARQPQLSTRGGSKKPPLECKPRTELQEPPAEVRGIEHGLDEAIEVAGGTQVGQPWRRETGRGPSDAGSAAGGEQRQVCPTHEPAAVALRWWPGQAWPACVCCPRDDAHPVSEGSERKTARERERERERVRERERERERDGGGGVEACVCARV